MLADEAIIIVVAAHEHEQLFGMFGNCSATVRCNVE